ncbi:MAG: glycosyltransferase family 2 protein [Acidobacteriaceae bacterium]|nr:glycosyltransferase family 2 protein [Acidobacteriaceae bacterium]
MNAASEPGLVSIVIPTYKRAADLRIAAESALAQTYPLIEVLIVSDGPDAEARAAVEGMDARLRYMELAQNRGPAEARNAGVRASRGEWLAFLDDDDIMLPAKIEHQMRLADATQPQRMIACCLVYRHDGREDVQPARPIGPDEDVADYILLRPGLMKRPGVLTLQALMVHRSILEAVPFTSHPEHEDWAWFLEAWHLAGARVEFVWEPLVIYNIAMDNLSRSRRTNWQDSLRWVERYREWIDGRTAASFLATKVALKAKRAGDWQGIRTVYAAMRRSKPGLLEWAFFLGIAMLPNALLQAAWKRSLRADAEAVNA